MQATAYLKSDYSNKDDVGDVDDYDDDDDDYVKLKKKMCIRIKKNLKRWTILWKSYKMYQSKNGGEYVHEHWHR